MQPRWVQTRRLLGVGILLSSARSLWAYGAAKTFTLAMQKWDSPSRSSWELSVGSHSIKAKTASRCSGGQGSMAPLVENSRNPATRQADTGRLSRRGKGIALTFIAIGLLTFVLPTLNLYPLHPPHLSWPAFA